MFESASRFRLAIFVAALCVSAAAQAKSDEQLWTTGAVNVDLGGGWRGSEEVVSRFSDNRDGLYELELTTMLGYRIKDVTIAAGYVHNPLYSDGDHTTTEHRAREQVTFDNITRVGPAKLSARMRIEQRWRDNARGTGLRARPYVKLSFPLAGKAALNLSNETFVNLNSTAFQARSGFDRMRNLLSVSGPLSKKLNGEIGYLNQYGFVRNGDDTIDHVAYFAVTLNL